MTEEEKKEKDKTPRKASSHEKEPTLNDFAKALSEYTKFPPMTNELFSQISGSNKIYEQSLRSIGDLSSLSGIGDLSSLSGIGDLKALSSSFQESLSNLYSWPTGNILDRASILEKEISSLRAEIDKKAKNLVDEKADAKKKEQLIKELEKDLKEHQEKQALSHLLNRVGTEAQAKLLTDKDFRELFTNENASQAYVVSIDIRRSTELMLKAREAKRFAQFVIDLAVLLRQEILNNYGIFDKFTGDGVLAFFPEFYSGDDAGFRAVRAALRCHKIFEKHYQDNRSSFVAVLQDTGLGIGIDYGSVQLVEIGGEFTVVGTPVVYACRMSAAEARNTYVNQPAYEQLFERYSVFDFEETEIQVKHEGRMLAYGVRSNGKEFPPQAPEWIAPQESKEEAPS
ncbi:MAG: adenylate/guanylate cyclase domain-containing protein [Thermoleophilia bacterium]